MCGTGSALEAAARLGRHWLGVEQSLATALQAQRRLAGLALGQGTPRALQARQGAAPGTDDGGLRGGADATAAG
jgi:hypothetical protein